MNVKAKKFEILHKGQSVDVAINGANIPQTFSFTKTTSYTTPKPYGKCHVSPHFLDVCCLFLVAGASLPATGHQ